MNSFTKDELTLLEDALFNDIGCNETDELRIYNAHILKFKIQTMIDEYSDNCTICNSTGMITGDTFINYTYMPVTINCPICKPIKDF